MTTDSDSIQNNSWEEKTKTWTCVVKALSIWVKERKPSSISKPLMSTFGNYLQKNIRCCWKSSCQTWLLMAFLCFFTSKNKEIFKWHWIYEVKWYQDFWGAFYGVVITGCTFRKKRNYLNLLAVFLCVFYFSTHLHFIPILELEEIHLGSFHVWWEHLILNK